MSIKGKGKTGSSADLFSEVQYAQRGLWQNMLRNLRSNPLAMVGLVLVLMVISLAILAPWVAPHDPLEVNLENKLLPPGGGVSPGHR